MEKKNTNTLGFFLLGLTLSLGMIAVAFCLSSTIEKVKIQNGKITVKGFASKEIISDSAKWDFNIKTPQSELKEAYIKLNNDKKKLFEFLKNRNIEENQIGKSNIYIQAIYKLNENGHATNEVEGYHLSQDFAVTSDKVDHIRQLSVDASDLIQEDIQLFSYQPQYFYQKLDLLKVSMLAEASRDAKLRATVLATNVDAKVGYLKSAQQGVFQITPQYSNSCSDYGECDTSSIVKNIKAIVTMEFSIN